MWLASSHARRGGHVCLPLLTRAEAALPLPSLYHILVSSRHVSRSEVILFTYSLAYYLPPHPQIGSSTKPQTSSVLFAATEHLGHTGQQIFVKLTNRRMNGQQANS